jgi:protein O-mannosyl-transferase
MRSGLSGAPRLIPGRGRALFAAWVGLCLVVALAYFSGRSAPFLLDDRLSIVENPSLQGGPWSLNALYPPAWSFTTGRPVLNWSFAANAGFCGLDPACFRWVNVGLHVLNATLLAGVLAQFLVNLGADYRGGTAPAWVGLGCGVIWASNPLHTAAVTYVSQRAEVLMATFLLAAVFCFLRGLASPRPWLWRMLAGLCFLLGVMTKESIFVAPLVCGALVMAAGPAGAGSRRRAGWEDYAAFLPGVVALAVFAVSTALASRLAVSDAKWIGLLHVEMQTRALGEYLRYALWPHPLVFDRGPLSNYPALAAYPLWLGVVCLMLGAVSLWALFRGRLAGLPGVLFFMLLAPTTSVVPVLGQPIAEHRLYLPLAALCAGSAVWAARRFPRGYLWGILVLSSLLLVLTASRNLDYKSVESIWSDTVSKAPLNHRARGSLGQELLSIPARRSEGIQHLREALRIEPREPETHYLLGAALLGGSEREEAEAHLRQCANLSPSHALARAQLALLLLQTGRSSEALVFAQQAVALRPDRADFRLLLGTALRLLPGRQAEAVAVLQAVADSVPENAEAWMQLGLAHGQTPEGQAHAIDTLVKATRLNPRLVPAWRALASILGSISGREDEARQCAERAAALERGVP